MAVRHRSDGAFLGIAALLFAASAAVTIAWCSSMTRMPGMDMPGGWTMSMAWMRMPGQSWFGAAATFLGMWSIMMLAMMLPAVTPALREYRRARAAPRANPSTARVAAAYFGVWVFAGLALYPLGLAFAEFAMRMSTLSRLVPLLSAAILVCAGLLQLSAWKERQLHCCRSERRPVTGAAETWRYGLRLGLRCVACCAPLTAALLVLGVMDIAAMTAATAAISLERLAPRGARFARLSGILLIGAGLALLLRAPA
jgi:predicted metal-binding membrane protein